MPKLMLDVPTRRSPVPLCPSEERRQAKAVLEKDEPLRRRSRRQATGLRFQHEIPEA
jgi:hypothetical protein